MKNYRILGTYLVWRVQFKVSNNMYFNVIKMIKPMEIGVTTSFEIKAIWNLRKNILWKINYHLTSVGLFSYTEVQKIKKKYLDIGLYKYH